MEFSFHIQKNSSGTEALAQYVVGLGMKKINVLSETDYQALNTSDPKTLYLVQNENGIKLYLGCVPIEAEQKLEQIETKLIALTTITENMMNIQVITQEEYNALENPDENTLYVLKN